MIHPGARIAVLICAIILAYYLRTVELTVSAVLVILCVAAMSKVLTLGLVFISAVIAPLLLSTIVFELAARGNVFEWAGILSSPETFSNVTRTPLLLTSRLAILGLALQIAFVPVIRAGRLIEFLAILGLGLRLSHPLVSSMNAFYEMSRSTRTVLDAIKSRGLTIGRPMWRIVEFPNVIVSVFSQSLRGAFDRDENSIVSLNEAWSYVRQKEFDWSIWKSIPLVLACGAFALAENAARHG